MSQDPVIHPKDVSSFLNSKVEDLTAELEQISDILISSYALTANLSIPYQNSSKSFGHVFKFKSQILKVLVIISLVVLSSGLIALFFTFIHSDDKIPIREMQTQFIIENLRGDAIDTWNSWKWASDSAMDVVISNQAQLPDSKIDIVRNAILSDEKITVDNSITHKGLKGTFSTYYRGWAGALDELRQASTKYSPPLSFNIILSDKDEGRIIIRLTNDVNSDGYSGYTKSTVSDNEILKSHITIYDADSLTDEQIATIVRHEFGHALGLGHSSAPEDLMAPIISATIPYISECNVEVLESLYDGHSEDSVVCQS